MCTAGGSSVIVMIIISIRQLLTLQVDKGHTAQRTLCSYNNFSVRADFLVGDCYESHKYSKSDYRMSSPSTFHRKDPPP
jgi:hypothetical protein